MPVPRGKEPGFLGLERAWPGTLTSCPACLEAGLLSACSRATLSSTWCSPGISCGRSCGPREGGDDIFDPQHAGCLGLGDLLQLLASGTCTSSYPYCWGPSQGTSGAAASSGWLTPDTQGHCPGGSEGDSVGTRVLPGHSGVLRRRLRASGAGLSPWWCSMAASMIRHW